MFHKSIMDDKWDCMLSQFRSLGGIADNVCQKEGEYGRGIFSVNPNLRSKIYTPSKLMINKEDMCLEDIQLRIKKDKNYSKELRDFFNYYLDTFSWGGEGKETVDSFEKGLSLFSRKLRELIKKYILVDLNERHTGNWDEIIFREFLKRRTYKFYKLSVVTPLVELFNHEVISLPFITETDGISSPIYPPINGELTFNYGSLSSIKRFFYQGFFCKETIVFSFPFSIHLKNLGIHLICKGKEIKDDFIKMERSNNKIILEGLPIADFNNPRLPINYFNEIFRRIGETNIPKNILLEIFELNIACRQEILKESKSIENEVSNMFSEIINYEINLISSYD